MIQNGYLIQNINHKMPFMAYMPQGTRYEGMTAFDIWPLLGVKGRRYEELSDLQMFKCVSQGWYIEKEFVTDMGLFTEYLAACSELGISTRVLLIESDYMDERLSVKNPFRITEVLGYEYCPIPLDCQIITDIYYFRPFRKYKKKLNTHGLFDDYETVRRFKEKYDSLSSKRIVGDDLEEAYIFRVSVVAPSV